MSELEQWLSFDNKIRQRYQHIFKIEAIKYLPNGRHSHLRNLFGSANFTCFTSDACACFNQNCTEGCLFGLRAVDRHAISMHLLEIPFKVLSQGENIIRLPNFWKLERRMGIEISIDGMSTELGSMYLYIHPEKYTIKDYTEETLPEYGPFKMFFERLVPA